VELRDVLPTFLDAGGAPGAETLDGRSLLSLARDSGAQWRPHIDLEHDICYAPGNHWNALTDGMWKYIFHARDGEEQLFHLDKDPHELEDLAGEAQHADTLRTWRERMVAHLTERGDEFVKDGALMKRPEPHLYSPHYPGCSCHAKG
jgi:arylsulfatase A-like enzyme